MVKYAKECEVRRIEGERSNTEGYMAKSELRRLVKSMAHYHYIIPQKRLELRSLI